MHATTCYIPCMLFYPGYPAFFNGFCVFYPRYVGIIGAQRRSPETQRLCAFESRRGEATEEETSGATRETETEDYRRADTGYGAGTPTPRCSPVEAQSWRTAGGAGQGTSHGTAQGEGPGLRWAASCGYRSRRTRLYLEPGADSGRFISTPPGQNAGYCTR